MEPDEIITYNGIQMRRDYAESLEEAQRLTWYVSENASARRIIFGTETYPMPDIIALVSLNLRAIGEYATYCGFDVSIQSERLFAMNVLGLASSPNDASKAVAMAQLVKIARDAAKKKAWKQLEGHAFVRILQQLAKALGIRLTKAKVAQVIPATGAFVGAGFNAYFTSKVCDAAYCLYRERFLATKYGDSGMIEVTVPPPDTLDPEYPEVGIPIPEGDVPPPDGAAIVTSTSVEPPPGMSNTT